MNCCDHAHQIFSNKYRSATRDKRPTTHVAFHQPMSRSDGEGVGNPQKCFLNDGHDVRKVVDIGTVRQPFTT
jgi:hypothetical protein